MITFAQSSCACVVIVAVFVLSLYMIPAKVRALPRDHDLHIQYRLGACTISTLVTIFAVRYWYDLGLAAGSVLKDQSFWRVLGVSVSHQSRHLEAIGLTIALMTLFYAGPALSFLLQLVQERRNTISADGTVHPRKLDAQANISYASLFTKKVHEQYLAATLEPYSVFR